MPSMAAWPLAWRPAARGNRRCRSHLHEAGVSELVPASCRGRGLLPFAETLTRLSPARPWILTRRFHRYARLSAPACRVRDADRCGTHRQAMTGQPSSSCIGAGLLGPNLPGALFKSFRVRALTRLRRVRRLPVRCTCLRRERDRQAQTGGRQDTCSSFACLACFAVELQCLGSSQRAGWTQSVGDARSSARLPQGFAEGEHPRGAASASPSPLPSPAAVLQAERITQSVLGSLSPGKEH